jgi:hypothetical protein
MRNFPGCIFMLVLLPLLVQAGEKNDIPPLHHVVDVRIPARMEIAADFPLSPQHKLQCKTCHGIENIQKTPFDEVDREADHFFRGGPYRKLSGLCYRCHSKADYARPNIHIQLDDERKPIERNCLFCHREVPDSRQAYQAGDIKLRLPAQKLCTGCHLRTPHLNAIEHRGEVGDDMLLQIEKTQKEARVILPLDERRVQCITCHAPHQKGVLDPQRAAATQVQDRELAQGVGYVEHPWNRVFQEDKRQRLEKQFKAASKRPELTYRRLSHEVLLRLPALNGRLCAACHRFEH